MPMDKYTYTNHSGATMKRLLAILFACGFLTLTVQLELLARGGGGRGGGGGGGARAGGGAARSGGGFSPSAGASRPASSASPRPSTGGAQKAAPRPSGSTNTAKAAPKTGGSANTAKAGTKSAGSANTAKAGTKTASPATGAKTAAKTGSASKSAQPAIAGKQPATGAGAAKSAAASRPSSAQLNNFLDVPGGATGAAKTAGAAKGGGAASDFLQSGAGKTAAGVGGAATGAALASGATNRTRGDAGRPGTAGENLSKNQPQRIENRGERQGERDQRQDEIRKQYEENNPGSFWEENPGWSAWAITRPFAWASWNSVGSWAGYSSEPASYSYGEEIYYSDGQVYSGDQPIATTEEYAEQAAAIATSEPAAEPAKNDWLPLGVFAITQDGQASGPDPSLYMQLAISKQSVISGTLKNTLTGKVQSLEGMADKESQRVAWVVVDQERPIMETGLSNLTQDTSPALIHFADGQTQQWLMVRMPEPKK
jgi:hypothetical protein